MRQEGVNAAGAKASSAGYLAILGRPHRSIVGAHREGRGRAAGRVGCFARLPEGI